MIRSDLAVNDWCGWLYLYAQLNRRLRTRITATPLRSLLQLVRQHFTLHEQLTESSRVPTPSSRRRRPHRRSQCTGRKAQKLCVDYRCTASRAFRRHQRGYGGRRQNPAQSTQPIRTIYTWSSRRCIRNLHTLCPIRRPGNRLQSPIRPRRRPQQRPRHPLDMC